MTKSRANRLTRSAGTAALFAVALNLLPFIVPIGSESARGNASSIISAFVALFATMAVLGRGWSRPGRERRGWMAFGAGMAMWTIGNVIWSYYTITGNEVPYPGSADYFWVAGYPLFLLGVISMARANGSIAERMRFGLDIAVGIAAVGFIAFELYVRDLLEVFVYGGLTEQAIGAAYPISDIYLFATVIVVAARPMRYGSAWSIVLIAFGSLATGVTDVIYLQSLAAGTFHELSLVNLGWVVSYAAWALAAIYSQDQQESVRPISRPQWSRLLLPYAAAVGLFLLQLVTAFRSDSAGQGLALGSLVVGVLIIARQWAAIAENRRLVETQRNELVASISHELRTPLTAMSGFTSILADDWRDLGEVELQEMLDIVDSQTNHLGGIVTDLVYVARDQLATTAIRPTETTSGELVAAATALASAPTVASEVAEDVTIIVDAPRVQQILVNLLTNAERYGEHEVALVTHRREGHVVFEVHDDGPGVPKKFEEIIWERFERGDNRFNASIPGSGLGLAIARDLATAHGGTMSYSRSTRLGGSCFSLVLPIAGLGSGATGVPALISTH